MWFPLALLALLCWSGSDLFSKIGSRPEDKLSHWKMVMTVGTVMGLHALFDIFVNKVPIDISVFITYLPASLLYIFAMVLGYVGLRYIQLSVSSPICNSSGAVASLLCFIFLDQRLDMLQTVGVILVCIGVVGLGIVERLVDDETRLLRQQRENLKYEKSAIALLFPLLYCFIDAAGTLADSMILEKLGEGSANSANIAYELTFLLMAVAAFIYVCLIKKERFIFRQEKPKMIAAIFETAGQFAYIFAIAANTIAAAPVISAYCMMSVIWSRIFLKEKLSLRHYLAITITVAGIVLLGFGE